jgi:hypothetical protein
LISCDIMVYILRCGLQRCETTSRQLCRLFLEQIIFPWYPRQANDSMPFPHWAHFPFAKSPESDTKSVVNMSRQYWNNHINKTLLVRVPSMIVVIKGIATSSIGSVSETTRDRHTSRSFSQRPKYLFDHNSTVGSVQSENVTNLFLGVTKRTLDFLYYLRRFEQSF